MEEVVGHRVKENEGGVIGVWKKGASRGGGNVVSLCLAANVENRK